MFVALPELFNVVQQILLGLNVSVMSGSFELPGDFPNPNARQSKSRCSVPSFPIPEVLLQVSISFFQPLIPRAPFFTSQVWLSSVKVFYP